MDSLQKRPAAPGNRPPAPTKPQWVRRVVGCLKATLWAHRLWDLGHKLAAYCADPESLGGKVFAALMDPESPLQPVVSLIKDITKGLFGW